MRAPTVSLVLSIVVAMPCLGDVAGVRRGLAIEPERWSMRESPGDPASMTYELSTREREAHEPDRSHVMSLDTAGLLSGQLYRQWASDQSAGYVESTVVDEHGNHFTASLTEPPPPPPHREHSHRGQRPAPHRHTPPLDVGFYWMAWLLQSMVEKYREVGNGDEQFFVDVAARPSFWVQRPAFTFELNVRWSS